MNDRTKPIANLSSAKHDNFFDPGGHSLLAMQVISRVKKTFGVDIQLCALFKSPTVAELAKLIVQKQAEAHSEGELALLLTGCRSRDRGDRSGEEVL